MCLRDPVVGALVNEDEEEVVSSNVLNPAPPFDPELAALLKERGMPAKMDIDQLIRSRTMPRVPSIDEVVATRDLSREDRVVPGLDGDPTIVVTTFKGRRVVGGKARGEALVCKAPLSLRIGIDATTGRVTEAGHPLEGKRLAHKVLVFASAQTSTGSSQICAAIANGVGPCAIVATAGRVGDFPAQIPVLDAVEPDPVTGIMSGDLLDVDADAGRITVVSRYTE